MNAVKAVWKNGRIVPVDPVDWPEGSELIVLPIEPDIERIGLTEAQWRDDPEAIAEWEATVRNLEPPVYTDEERLELARFRDEIRQYSNEAVRRQMQAGDE